MKKICRFLSIAAMAALAFSACTEELNNDNINGRKTVTVHFGTENTDPSTKATLTPDAGETVFHAAWEKGDKIAIKYTYVADNISEAVPGTWDASASKFSAELTDLTTGDEVFEMKYQASYPYSETEYVDFGSARTQTGNVYNSVYDLMVAEPVTVTAKPGLDESGNAIVFPMQRQTAIAYFHFTSDNIEAITKATLKVEGEGAAIAAETVLLDPTGMDYETGLSEIVLTTTDQKADDFTLWFNVLPTTYTKMTLTVETATKTFTISKNTEGKTEGKYVAGKLYKVKKERIAWTNKVVTPTTPEPVVLYCSDVTTGSYNSAVSHIKNANLPFEYLQIMANGKNSPSGYGAGQVMQFKSSLGEIYNTESFGSPVKYVEVFAQSSNPFYVYYGDKKAPSENKISRPTTPNGSKTISIEDNNGNKNVEEKVNYYLLNLSSYNANYIRIVNGSSTNYFYKIVLRFDEPETVRVTGIALDKTEVTINEGETATLTATISPADATTKEITWTSDNETVATVTDGVVSGLSAGSATITATTVDGEFTASCLVTVNKLSKISTIAEIKAILKDGTSSSTKAFDARLTRAVVTYVNGNYAFIEDETAAILYYKSEHGLNVGDVLSGDFAGSGYSYYGVVEITSVTTTPTITAGTAPDPTVATLAQISANFDAYDSRWVKLENVTTGVALASGTRTSSVSQNGSTLPMYAKVKDTELAAESYGDMLCIPCYNKTTKQIGFWEAAHFTAKNVAVTGITLDKSEVSITVGKTATLTTTITPSNATNKNVSWTSNAKGVATVENGVVTAVAEGNATITVTTEDGNYSATCDVTVTAASTGGAAVKTYKHVFTAKPSTGDNVTLSGVSWNITATNLNNYNSNNYAGVQFGTSSKNGQITLTSPSAWSYTVDDVTVTKIKEVRLWLNLGGTSVTPSVSIGGTAAISDGKTVTKNSTAGNDWTKATKVTFTPAAGSDTGVIVIDVTSVKAGYICAIEIDAE